MRRAILLILLLIILLCSCKNQDLPSSLPQSSVPSISQAFELPESAFLYQIIDGNMEITAYTGNDTVVYIPAKICNLEVTAIAEEAFYQCVDMEEIHLPDTLKRLDANAFYRCYSLKNVHIPSGVCTIKGNPFFRCSSLTAITVTDKNEYFSSVDGALYTKDHSCLLAYPEGKKSVAYTVPDSVKEIGLDAFGYHPLFKYITIHEGVTTFPSDNLFIFPEEVVLYVQTGSSAEKYAKRYELQYENFS